MGRSALFKLIGTTRKISLALSDRTESFTHFLCLLKRAQILEGGERLPTVSVGAGKAINHQAPRDPNTSSASVYTYV